MERSTDVSGIQSKGATFTLPNMISAIACLIVFGTFTLYGQQDRGVIAGFSAASLIFTIRARWGLRLQAWFWITIALLAMAHVAAIYLWGWKIVIKPTILLSPLVIVDFAACVWVTFLVERAVGNAKT